MVILKKLLLPIFIFFHLGMLLASSIPSDSIAERGMSLVSGAHMHIIAFIMFSSLSYAVMHSRKINHPVVLSISYSIMFGTLIEFMQHFIAYRHASLSDIFVDSLASVIGSLSAYILLKNELIKDMLE